MYYIIAKTFYQVYVERSERGEKMSRESSHNLPVSWGQFHLAQQDADLVCHYVWWGMRKSLFFLLKSMFRFLSIYGNFSQSPFAFIVATSTLPLRIEKHNRTLEIEFRFDI
jgi:hypothetical protein